LIFGAVTAFFFSCGVPTLLLGRLIAAYVVPPSATNNANTLSATRGRPRAELTSGHAVLQLFLKTTDGSLHWELGVAHGDGTAYALDTSLPPGTLSTLQNLGEDDGGTAPSDYESNAEGVQLAPVAGYLSLHIAVIDTTVPAHTCHLAINVIPETVTASSALERHGTTETPIGRILGNR
jgi:hypothetical protein